MDVVRLLDAVQVSAAVQAVAAVFIVVLTWRLARTAREATRGVSPPARRLDKRLGSRGEAGRCG